ncbi:cytochrome c [Granulicella sp. 5B5]|uniref:c-type cytochrome n=1 Tax=Granulicella sp. 5B5 TaxID=1617967 RepID=UPI0015F4EF3B|nr:cytochrome c [Granulicella sp. 5B5]
MTHRIQTALIAIVAAASTVAAGLAQAPGANTYRTKCAMCHAADGSGNMPAGKATATPSFKFPVMLKMSDADFIGYTKNGKGKMPAYSSKLTETEIKDVVGYIRTLQRK